MRSCFAPICIPCDKWYITGSSFGAAAGSDAVVNDSPVGCQSRGVTEPAGETLPLPSLHNSKIVLSNGFGGGKPPTLRYGRE